MSKYDIFISYGHLDDEEDPAGDEKGWIDLFVKRLVNVVATHLGYKPKIWRDEQSLSGDARLRAAIEEGVAHSSLFVPIVSPRYVQSEWCLRELEAFCRKPAIPAAPAHRSGIFKVTKTPLLRHVEELEPKPLRELVGYDFFEMDGERPVEFSPDLKPAKDPRYWSALERVAWEIFTMLADLKSEPQKSQVSSQPTNGTRNFVYLAETSSDLTHERDLVRDELLQRGYGVLPEEKLPTAEVRQTEAAALASLSRSVLSVHMIGRPYGLTPEDDARSVISIQEALAARRSANDPSFSRLLWMPPGLMTTALEVVDERQKAFITALRNRVSAGAELLETKVEDLKTRVVERLTPPETTAKSSGRSKLKQVYLICENRDRSLVRPIKQYLFEQQLEVITWLDGDAAGKHTDYHHKNLCECDAALVYFGNGDEPWVRKNLEDLEKAYGYGREHDWCANVVYVGAPKNDEKQDFLTHLAPVIRNYDSFNPNDLREFLLAVHECERGQQ